MKKDFEGVFIPNDIWRGDYKTIEEREKAIFAYLVQEYGLEVAKAGGFKDGK